MSELPKTSNYEKFNPELYMQSYAAESLDKMTRKSAALAQFHLDKIHTIFNSGVVKGRRLLDVGTGPDLASVISASQYVQEIYLSDITTSNLNILRDWWTCKRDMNNASFDYVAQKEGKVCTVVDKQNNLRSKVKGILWIDITSVKPLGEGIDIGKFDIITSKLCLESATNTEDEYRRCVNNLTSLLCQGGFLIIAGVTGCTFYRVGDFFFAANPIGRNEIERAFSDVGAPIQQYTEEIDSFKDDNQDSKDKFVLVAKKV